ncbi:MAG: hypothetical protein AB1540_16145 [Bdellovibrionota bacterium]
MNIFWRTIKLTGLAAVLAMLLVYPLTARSAKSDKKATRVSEKNAAKQELLLYKGLQTTMDLPFEPCSPTEECIKVTNKGIVLPQFVRDKKQLVFTPIARGETTITVRNENADLNLILKVIVSEHNLARKANEIQTLLRDIEGLDIKILGDKIVVDGEVVVVTDLVRVYSVLNDPSYKDLVLNLVGVSPVGLQILAQRMQQEINRPNVRVRVFNGLFLVEGQVENNNEAETVLNIARSMVQGIILPKYDSDTKTPIGVLSPKVRDPIIPRLTVAAPKKAPPEKMVRITVDFVELSKDYLRNFGFSWIPSLDTGGSISFGQSTTGGVTSAGTGSLSGTIGNLFPKLNSAQNAGYARILEESVMIVKSGQETGLARQLQVPVQIINDRGQSDFRIVNLGPNIRITPRIVGGTEDVDMNIDFRYDGFAGKQGSVPIVLSHNYKSAVIVKSGESAAVVNALSNAISTNFNKDPPGGSTPANPLFTLLRSKAFQKQKSQFVVFLTPQVISSASTGTEDIKSKYGMKRKQ